jgi:gas vesicle protein
LKIEKAIAISDAKIQFISLVDKAANKRQFLITKADDGQAQFSTLGKILKVDEATHYVTGVVYEPLVEDSHGNFMTEDEIRKAAYWFAKNGDKVDLQHSFEQVAGVTVVETYVALCDMEIDGQPVIKGTWLMTAEVENADVWDKVQKGEVTGFSMGGVGKYSETETDLTESVEKRGVFKKLAELLGFDVVEKGEVADRYAQSIKNSSFWDAWYALEETLRRYNWQTDRYEFITDEAVIREALTEFSGIIASVLATANVVKALGAEPVTKAGKKISGKNRDTLQSIYDNLGGVLAEFVEENEEEFDVTKQEIQTLVEETVKKAFDELPAAKAAKEPVGAPAAETPLTAESVQKMVDAAIAKALAPADEPLTAESVQTMVADAVAKAVEPVLKARGVSSNIDDKKLVEKTDRHYLAGIL